VTKRLALLAGMLVAVPGPHDGALIAFVRGGDQDDGLPSYLDRGPGRRRDQPDHLRHGPGPDAGLAAAVAPGAYPGSARGTTRVGTEAWRTRAEETVPSRTRRTGP
jgi:hypothetical protein